MEKKTDIYFHNFRSRKRPNSFDILSLRSSTATLEDVFNQIKAVLKINKNVLMTGYAIRDIRKLTYSWDYNLNPNGYGPRNNFKPLKKNTIVTRYPQILVNYHHSQHNEDYIIEKIFDRIGTPNRYFVEFGAGDGKTISNTILLRYNGWKGLLIESSNQLPAALPNAICVRDLVTPDNIETIFGRAGVPKEFDFLSIDIDGNDYYIWEALKNYKPRVLCIEVEGRSKDIRELGPYLEPYNKKSAEAPRCSILVMTELSAKKGYKLIYNNGGNVFYLRDKEYLHFKPLKGVKWNEPCVATVDLF